MSRHVALLRAVNVGGRKLSMSDLRGLVADLGGTDVETYLQSGNVVFTAPKSVAATLADAVSAHCGFDVRIFLRSGRDLASLNNGQPLAGPETAWHVTFLATAANPAAVDAIDGTAYPPDEFAVVRREVYLRTPGGYGRTKLNNTFWERKLEVDATTRNWRTVRALAEMAAG